MSSKPSGRSQPPAKQKHQTFRIVSAVPFYRLDPFLHLETALLPLKILFHIFFRIPEKHKLSAEWLPRGSEP